MQGRVGGGQPGGGALASAPAARHSAAEQGAVGGQRRAKGIRGRQEGGRTCSGGGGTKLCCALHCTASITSWTVTSPRGVPDLPPIVCGARAGERLVGGRRRA